MIVDYPADTIDSESTEDEAYTSNVDTDTYGSYVPPESIKFDLPEDPYVNYGKVKYDDESE